MKNKKKRNMIYRKRKRKPPIKKNKSTLTKMTPKMKAAKKSNSSYRHLS